MKALLLVLLLSAALCQNGCDSCYSQSMDQNCPADKEGKGSYTLHMTVHPHLDAFWIFNFESYYKPKASQGDVRSYFMQNRFTAVKDIFSIAKDVLWKSKQERQTVSNRSQSAHRMFVNSEMGFFKRWYKEQQHEDREKVKELLKTKYWQILGGGYVEQDQGCAYYDDIIQNFQLGLHFLKTQFDYYPKVAVAADSFGHSQSTLAILAHLGIQGYFVERSDEHMLLQNKTEFVWKAKSANGQYYGALPTHIRWAIHGFEDQFIGGDMNEDMCQTKEPYIRNLRNENQFLKRILKSTHIMRYFGHDFQKFDEYSYTVMQGMMKKFSMEKCNKVTAVYGNPTEYFIALMGEVFGKNVKPVATRSEDIMPIWDYDSGLYWSGYFTTDAYHKKDYRDLGRLLYGVRKMFMNIWANQPTSDRNKDYYKFLEAVAEQVSYLQHHDGISGTSKYSVMDQLEQLNEHLTKKLKQGVIKTVFEQEFPLGTNAPLFSCHLGELCKIPQTSQGDVYLKIINTDGNPIRDPIIVQVPLEKYYVPDCEYEMNCFCYEDVCPCRLYLYKLLFAFTTIRLKKVDSAKGITINKLSKFIPSSEYQHTKTHFTISIDGKAYSIGYKRVGARPTPRHYDHLSRYGQQYSRSFTIRPGKYALGNDPNDIKDFSEIKRVSKLQSKKMEFLLIEWKRYKMTTLISISKSMKNQWKVETITATESYHLSDLYFEVITPIENNNKFVTDSNGWLTLKRQMFKHEDYQAHFSKEKYDDLDGNSYPITAFVYIEDSKDKVSVNVERPQGATAYKPGTIWINFDRLSEDDGKWVYQSAFRSQYQKYTHTVTVQNKNNNQRKIQRQHDQHLFIQGNELSPSQRVESTEVDVAKRNKWNDVSNIDSLKFSVRPFNDNTTTVRVQNMNDSADLTIGLFAGKMSPILTTYYARTVTFDSITEMSLGGNMPYTKFVQDKWNWHKVIDLSGENQIFNKEFKENITLRPLQIRTFKFSNLKFSDQCHEVSQLKYSQEGIMYKLNINKDMPERDELTKKLEMDIIQFNQEGDHCHGESPVLKKGNVDVSSQAKKESQEEFKTQRVEPTKVDVRDPIKPPPEPTPFRPSNSQNRPKPGDSKRPVEPTTLTLAQILQRINEQKPIPANLKRRYFDFKWEQIKNKVEAAKKN